MLEFMIIGKLEKIIIVKNNWLHQYTKSIFFPIYLPDVKL